MMHMILALMAFFLTIFSVLQRDFNKYLLMSMALGRCLSFVIANELNEHSAGPHDRGTGFRVDDGMIE